MNPEVIAVDQDRKGEQGHRVWDEGPLEIWVKSLADGSKAAGLFNRGESNLKITLNFKQIGAPASAKLRRRLRGDAGLLLRQVAPDREGKDTVGPAGRGGKRHEDSQCLGDRGVKRSECGLQPPQHA